MADWQINKKLAWEDAMHRFYPQSRATTSTCACIGGRQSVGTQEVASSGSTGCKPHTQDAAALMFRKVTKQHDSMRAGDHGGIWPMRQILEKTGKLRDEEVQLLDFITDAGPPMAHTAYLAGEIYLAFFNLDSMSRKMTIQISDLGKVLRTFLKKDLCSCTAVWSGKNFGPVNEEISAVVNSHGSMLFEIIC